MYYIVATKEANLKEGKISIESPIARGLIGKSLGESVIITIPAGTLEFEILKIEI